MATVSARSAWWLAIRPATLTASAAPVLVGAGAKTSPEELVPQVYLPDRKGSLQVEMLAAARRHGMVSYALAPRFEDLLRELAAGNPVVVLQDLGLPPDAEGVSEGFRCVEEILALKPQTKTIVVTGHHETANAMRATL